MIQQKSFAQIVLTDPPPPASPIGSGIVGKHLKGAFALRLPLSPHYCFSLNNFCSKLILAGGKVLDAANIFIPGDQWQEKQEKLRENIKRKLHSHFGLSRKKFPQFSILYSYNKHCCPNDPNIFSDSVCGHRGVAFVWALSIGDCPSKQVYFWSVKRSTFKQYSNSI